MSTTFANDDRAKAQAGEGFDVFSLREVTLSVPKPAAPGLRRKSPCTCLEDRVNNRPATVYTDSELEDRCREALGWATTLPEQAVHISAKHGQVTLRGQLSQTAQSQAAEEIVRTVPGVSGLQNEICIG